MERNYVGLPPYHVHPETLLVVGILVVSYLFGLVYFGGERDKRAGRGQVLSFLGGCLVLYVSLSWPLHDLADGYLYSAHMVQHVLLSLVVAPMLLLGTPGWLADAVLAKPLRRVVAWLARPIVATLVFNAIVAFTHWPLAVDSMSRSAVFHDAVHAMLLAASVVMWLPVLSPTEAIQRISPPAQMLYLFVQSLLPTIPASFFTFATGVIVPYYGEAPRLFGISVLADQQFAGFVMKVVAGLVLWAWIGTIFFRWYAAEGVDAGWAARGGARGHGGGGGGPSPSPSPTSTPGSMAHDMTDMSPDRTPSGSVAASEEAERLPREPAKVAE